MGATVYIDSTGGMKKKYRSIIVEGGKYLWQVSHPNCDGDGNCRLKIVIDGPVRIVIFDDVTKLNHVLPRDIRKMILNVKGPH